MQVSGYTDTVMFNGVCYPTISLNIKGFGWNTIAQKSLQEKLLVDDRYVSDDARCIDEQIFYYVEDSVFNEYTSDELQKYVEKNVN